jgi:hypothetical protein
MADGKRIDQGKSGVILIGPRNNIVIQLSDLSDFITHIDFICIIHIQLLGYNSIKFVFFKFYWRILFNNKSKSIMSKFDECIETYKKEFDKLKISYDLDLLTKVAKGCGPSIYNTDASKVSSADKEELARVKNNFLIKKLGLKDGTELDDAIAGVVDQFGSSNRNKYRAMFYYLLTKKFKKESVYA